MNRSRHTRHYNHTRGNRAGIRENFGKKVQICGFGGKGKLCKEEPTSIAEIAITEIEAQTLSLENVKDRFNVLIRDWPVTPDLD